MDTFLKNFFNNSPVDFAETPRPSAVEQPAGASGTENQNAQGLQPEAAKTTLGEIIQRGKEGQTEQQGTQAGEKAEMRRRTQEARDRTQDATRRTRETADELRNHGEGDYVIEQIDRADVNRDRKLDKAGEKADGKKDGVVEKARGKLKQVDAKLAEAFDKFFKSLGNLAKDSLKLFLKMATNVVNSMRALLAGKIEGHYADKADRYAAKAKQARREGNDNRAEMMDARKNRSMATSRNVRERANEYYYRSHGMRDEANKLRAQRTGNAELTQQHLDTAA